MTTTKFQDPRAKAIAQQIEAIKVLSRDTCNFRQDGLETIAMPMF